MENNRKIYGVEDLKIRVVQDEAAKNTYFVFSTLMETQFYSPGVKFLASDKSITLEFVRAGIKDKDFQIDMKAEYLANWMKNRDFSPVLKDRLLDKSTSADQLLLLPSDVSTIYIKDTKGKKLVWNK